MSNKHVMARWFEEVWNQRQVSAIDNLMAIDHAGHGLGADGGDLVGPHEFKPYHQAFLDAMPDLRITVDDLIEEGDRVVARWTARGTLTGPGLGLAPTGKPMTVTGVSIGRIAGGRITESWNTFDLLHMHRQLGTLTQVAAV
jgi:steroid delta-isomerase-like uncharacterized protein